MGEQGGWADGMAGGRADWKREMWCGGGWRQCEGRLVYFVGVGKPGVTGHGSVHFWEDDGRLGRFGPGMAPRAAFSRTAAKLPLRSRTSESNCSVTGSWALGGKRVRREYERLHVARQRNEDTAQTSKLGRVERGGGLAGPGDQAGLADCGDSLTGAANFPLHVSPESGLDEWISR